MAAENIINLTNVFTVNLLKMFSDQRNILKRETVEMVDTSGELEQKIKKMFLKKGQVNGAHA